jgi:hypothetical protein
MMLHDPGPARHLDRAFRPEEDNVADNAGQDGGAPQEGAVPDGTQGNEAADAGPGALDDQPTTRHLRRRPNLRGHIVVDDDEPLPVFDAPAEPPPAPPDSPASQG